MPSGKLLDNNVISVLARPDDSRRPIAEAHLSASAPGPILLPCIAIGEIKFGMAKATHPDPVQQASMREFFTRYPILAFDEHTTEPYSLIRARLWHKLATPPASGRGHKEKLPEELKDRVTGKTLGIDERDLIIVSIAVQHNLTLATMDRNPGMLRIEEAASELEAENKPVRLRVEDWSQPLPTSN